MLLSDRKPSVVPIIDKDSNKMIIELFAVK